MNYIHKKIVFLSLLRKESRDLFKAPILLIIIVITTLCSFYINFFYDRSDLSFIFFDNPHNFGLIVSLFIIIQYINDSTLNDIENGGVIFLLNTGSSLRILYFVKVMFGVFIGFLITIWRIFRNDNITFHYIFFVFTLFYNIGMICIIVSSLCDKDRTIQWFITTFFTISYYFTLLKINNIFITYLLHIFVFIITQLIFSGCIKSSNFRKQLK